MGSICIPFPLSSERFGKDVRKRALFGMLSCGCMRACQVTLSHVQLGDSMDCSLPGSPSMGFSRQEYWSGMTLPSLVSSKAKLKKI